MTKLRAVGDRALAVIAVANRARVDAEMLGHDPGADLVQDVVPRERAELRVGARPPDDAELVEVEQTGTCTLDAGEVKLVDLLGGEDPVLVEIETDELISFGE